MYVTKGPKPGNVKVDWASWKDEDEGFSPFLLRNVLSGVYVLGDTHADI